MSSASTTDSAPAAASASAATDAKAQPTDDAGAGAGDDFYGAVLIPGVTATHPCGAEGQADPLVAEKCIYSKTSLAKMVAPACHKCGDGWDAPYSICVSEVTDVSHFRMALLRLRISNTVKQMKCKHGGALILVEPTDFGAMEWSGLSYPGLAALHVQYRVDVDALIEAGAATDDAVEDDAPDASEPDTPTGGGDGGAAVVAPAPAAGAAAAAAADPPKLSDESPLAKYFFSAHTPAE